MTATASVLEVGDIVFLSVICSKLILDFRKNAAEIISTVFQLAVCRTRLGVQLMTHEQ